MSATATGIPDVVSVRPATTTAAPAAAPAGDFGAIVALLSRAAQPAGANGAAAAGAPAVIPADAAASPSAAQAAVVPAPLARPEPEPAPLTTVLGEMDSPTESSVRESLALAETSTVRAGEGGPDDDPASEERTLPDDAEAVAAQAPVIVMTALVPPAPAIIAHSPSAATTERAAATSTSSSADAIAAASSRPGATAASLASPRSASLRPVGSSAVAASPVSQSTSADASPLSSFPPAAPGARASRVASPATGVSASSGASAAAGASVSSGAVASIDWLAPSPVSGPSGPAVAAPESATSSLTTAASGASAQSAEPWIEASASARGVARPEPVAPNALAPSDAEPDVPAAREAAPRRDVVTAVLGPRAAAPATFTQQADTISMPPVTIGLTPSAELVSGVRRARTETAREDAPRGPEPVALEATPSVETGAMSFEAWTSAARAMAADEPAAPEHVRPAVVEQVATRLGELRREGQHEITMRLDPPELGGVTIDARLDGGRLTVHIRAEHGATQELLADALPRLRESLAQQGFVPEQVSVQLGFEGGGAFGGGTARDHARAFTAPPSLAPASPAPARAPRVSATAPAGTRGGLDVWA